MRGRGARGGSRISGAGMEPREGRIKNGAPPDAVGPVKRIFK